MSTNPALRAGILAIASLATAFAQTYHATIVTEDGSPLPTTPQIIPDLSDRLVQECVITNTFGNGSLQYLVNLRSRAYDPATADMCSVTIRLKGYRTTQATLRNDSTVVLKRVGLHEGSTVSASALNAPEPAKKIYGKGVNAMTDEKWAVAQKDFEKAVEIYPDYAAAWSDLGEVLQKQAKAADARAAWEKAVQADPKYIKPYIQLMMLDLAEKRPEDAVTIGGRAVAMNPLEFPELYFYFAAANYNLKHFDVAEVNAKRATELDNAHEIPRAELLLASTLIARGDRAGALQHFKKYLEIVPKAADAEQVKRAVAQLETAPSGDAK
ncbi:MAG TPA: tetratricopeptide repeat protein [Bryobacteraceae bacterium]|jgi:tetratricopeptide (TPR) repeat protein|nr:tetratricopeptide repeat protein [Bryobacteraceae bacterium]